MNATAKLMTAEASELRDAMRPTFPKEQVERFLKALQGYATKAPHVTFDRSVREHREELEDLSEFMCELSYISQGMRESAAQVSNELHKAIDQALPAAQRRLRITRAALARLAGDRSGQEESGEILDAVERIFADQREATKHRWTPEELASFDSQPVDPAETEDWLNA